MCAAFPAGIPEEILDGKNNHRAPYPGDQGIHYEPNESERGYLAEIAKKTPRKK